MAGTWKDKMKRRVYEKKRREKLLFRCGTCGRMADIRYSVGDWCGGCYSSIVHDKKHSKCDDPAERESRIRLYEERASQGLDLFTGGVATCAAD